MIEIHERETIAGQPAVEDESCRDGDGLGAWSGHGFTVGQVDEVNGLGAEECEGYRPTRCELRQLARYWYQQRLDLQIRYFLIGESSSTGWRLSSYSQRRLDRLAEILGAEAIDEVVAEVESDACERLGAEWWEIFKNGNRQQWDAVLDEVMEPFRDAG
jgi:hypothetical protein